MSHLENNLLSADWYTQWTWRMRAFFVDDRMGRSSGKWWYVISFSLEIIRYSIAQQGSVTCVRWITCSYDDEEILCYRMALGYVGVWAHQLVSRRLIVICLCLSFKSGQVQRIECSPSSHWPWDFINRKRYIHWHQGKPLNSTFKLWWFDYTYGNRQERCAGAYLEQGSI